jgi:outer membrane immunogenic protein
MIKLLASTSLGLLVLAAPAIAAEMVPPPEVYDWSGFYVGGNLGAAINDSNVDQHLNSGDLGPLGRELKNQIQDNQTVFTGGGELGYNWQFNGGWVLGAEADFNWTDFNDSSHHHRDIDGLGTVDTDLSLEADWFGTLRGRLGFAVNNWLIYGTGGAAYGHVRAEGKIAFDNENGDFFKGSESSVNWGWTAGGGVEYAFDQNWIVGAEALYVDLGSNDFNFKNGAINEIHENINGHVDERFIVARGTVKFKF